MLAWLSGCTALLDVFHKGQDPYIAFGSELYAKDYDEVTKAERQICKPGVLGCGFGMGGGQEKTLSTGQKIKTGMWKYAESYGISLTRKEAHRMVQVYRDSYLEVPQLWGFLGEAFYAAYKSRKQQQVGDLFFRSDKDSVRISLPSGRDIHYLNPHAYRDGDGLHISFDGLRTGGWGRQNTWGGKLTENVVQAVARDILADGMMRAERMGLTIVAHTHDEIVCEVPACWVNNQGEVLADLMSQPVDWASGLPLGAEGFTTDYYTKG